MKLTESGIVNPTSSLKLTFKTSNEGTGGINLIRGEGRESLVGPEKHKRMGSFMNGSDSPVSETSI